MKETLKPGLAHTMQYLVPRDRTVPHLLPESSHFIAMPEVLATGYLVGIIEWACMETIAEHLDEGEQTLGIHVNLSHEAPTIPGSTVTVDVALTEVDGRVLTFDIHAHDEHAVISTGSHQRAVINHNRFRARLEHQSGATGT